MAEKIKCDRTKIRVLETILKKSNRDYYKGIDTCKEKS